MEKSIVCDTGTLLSIFLIGKHVKGFLRKFNSKYIATVSSSTLEELKEFAKHDDLLGNIAKKILKKRLEAITVKDSEIAAIKKEIGVSGKRRITDVDLKCFILAKKKDLAFFTDDFSVLIHLSSFFPHKEIFHGIALCADILSELLSKEQVYEYIFSKFIPDRFPKITEKRLADLEKIVTDILFD